MTIKELEDLYEIAAQKPGWVFKLEQILTPEEMNYVLWLDDSQAGVRSDLADWDKEVEHSGGADVYLAEGPEEKIVLLSEGIAALEQEYAAHRTAGKPCMERLLVLEVASYSRLVRLRSKWQAVIWHRDHPAKPGEISDADIDAARLVPLESLIEVNRTHMARCPFHEDKHPSLWVKGGWGYCFSCAKSCDSIKYVMQTSGVRFMEAVKQLAGRRAA